MKKILLILSLYCFVFQLFSQHKEAFIPFELDNKSSVFPGFEFDNQNPSYQNYILPLKSKDFNVGETWYDLQTYNALQHRTYTWPDGSIGVTWLMGFNPGGWPDLGTAYNYYNGMEWQAQSTSTIEEVKTYCPSLAPFGENGEIISSQFNENSSWGVIFHSREQRGIGDWESFSLMGPGANGLAWPSLITSGTNHTTLHLLARTTGDEYMGQGGALLYYRSTDGGLSWDIEHYFFEELGPTYLTNVSGDGYAWAAPIGDTLAFSVGFKTEDGYVMKSSDNGESWQKIDVYNSPFSPYPGGATPTYGAGDITQSVAMDAEGKVHVVFGRMKYFYEADGTLHYFPASEGLIYWNEEMQTLDSTIVSSYTLDLLEENGNLVGWIPSGELIGWGNYYVSLTSWPQIATDDNNGVYIFYTGVTPGFDNGLLNYRHIFRNSSYDNGESWTGPEDQNSSLWYILSECIYPSISPKIVNNKLNLFFQEDGEPGFYVWTGQQANPTDNKIVFMELETGNTTGIQELPDEDIRASEFSPNPISGQSVIKIDSRNITTVSYIITDASGRTIWTKLNHVLLQGKNYFTFTNPGFSSGLYFFNIVTTEKTMTRKIFVK